LRRAQIESTPDVVEGLVVYYDLLMAWNRRINLTSLPDGDLAVDRLLVEPLRAASHVPEGTAVVVDVGSGGGSPAIPLKLAVPTIRLSMIESKTRKAAFLREAIRELGLDSRVETARFEEVLGRSSVVGTADLVTLRGLRADLRALASLHAFLRPGGQIFYFGAVGAAAGLAVPPQLEVVGVEPLVASLQSALVRIRKRDRTGPLPGGSGRGPA
jgi:16S rRNA (guanine527-N7)-methyltransferase